MSKPSIKWSKDIKNMLQTGPDGRKYDPNDYKVVEFHNSADFDFTPELGAMYDGRPLFVGKGERRQFPYHIGMTLAKNLAKAVMLKGAPTDEPNNPTGRVLWNDDSLLRLKQSYITELYSEETPVARTETDRLFEKIAELERLVKAGNAAPADVAPVQQEVRPPLPGDDEKPKEVTYRDKQEVIAELEKRNITHDKRSKKEDLEKLLK